MEQTSLIRSLIQDRSKDLKKKLVIQSRRLVAQMEQDGLPGEDIQGGPIIVALAYD